MHKAKRALFPLLYGMAVLAAAALVLADTFWIPKALAAVPQSADSSAGSAAQADSTTDGSDGQDTADSGGQAVVTATSYQDDNISITLTTERVADTTVYLADITLSDISYLKTAFAENTYGRNIKQTTSAMAEENGAILAINGDYYGFRNSGYVLRNGTLYRDTSAGNEGLAILSDGSFYTFTEGEESAESLVEMGTLQVFSFGPVLVKDGAVAVSQNAEVSQAKTSNPRTAIGCISPLHYIIAVSDGRTDESSGLSLYQLAQVLQEQGCEAAYNLDGGGSSTLWFNGEVVNVPTGGSAGNGTSERQVSDIVYIG